MKSIRIGTRNSPLAMWQAEEVSEKIKALGVDTEITPILATGDKNLNQPLYTLGITGVFTKDLDIALLNGQIDIAVHSLKDVPTELPANIELVACLQRDYPQDVLVRNPSAKDKPLAELKIATSSLRRRAFWLKEFPGTAFEDIRGNVQTRLNKLNDGLADATMFSLAGIKRLGLMIDYEEIPFMISAPAQGVVAIAGRTDNVEINEIIKKINHAETQHCIEVERVFLNTLEGGCTAPIGAFAEILNGQMRFVARLCSLDGKNCIETDEIMEVSDYKTAGQMIAKTIIEKGGQEIMNRIKIQN